jgi:hypothetical protein
VFKNTGKCFVQCHVFIHSPPGQQPNGECPTLQTADLCKNISVAVLFDSNGNSYTTSTDQMHIYIHTHTPHSKDAGWTKERKKKNKIKGVGGAAVMMCAKEIFSHDILGTCVIVSQALICIFNASCLL